MAAAEPLFRLRELSIRLRRLPETPWIEMEVDDHPVVLVRVGGRPPRGRPPGVVVPGGRRVSFRRRPGRTDWTGRRIIWNPPMEMWVWTHLGPYNGFMHTVF